MNQRTRIMLDVDTGIDDAAALAYAVGSPDADLVAVSTVAGNCPIEFATRNTLDVLHRLGADAVPVHRGASRPLVRDLFTAAHAHGENGVGGARLEPSPRTAEELRGPAAMIHYASQYPNELTLVCLGPLTNLAIALNVEPNLTRMVDKVVIMGGAFWTAGNVRPAKVAEFNLFVDPEAAAQVFAADWPSIWAVGLDVTHRAPLDAGVWAAIESAQSPAGRLVTDLYRSRVEQPDSGTPYIHDAMAVAAALDPDLIGWQDHAVAIATDEPARGQSRLERGTNVHVAREVEAPKFMSRFFDRLAIEATPSEAS